MPLVYVGALNLALMGDGPQTPRQIWIFRVFTVLLIGSVLFGSRTMLSGSNYSNGKRIHNIADERGFYYQKFGLLSKHRQWPTPVPAPTLTKKSRVRSLCGQLGHTGLGMSSSIRLIDTCGLTDGLIARLPAIHTPYWRTGHPERKVPTGYADALAGKRVGPTEPSIQKLYSDVEKVTTGPLFDWDRWAAIYRLNISFPYSVDSTLYSSPHRPLNPARVKRVSLEQISTKTLENGTPYRRRGNVYFKRHLKVEFRSIDEGKTLELSLDSNDAYDVIINETYTHRIEKSQRLAPRGGLVSHQIPLPQKMRVRSVFIVALAGDGRCALGHIRLD